MRGFNQIPVSGSAFLKTESAMPPKRGSSRSSESAFDEKENYQQPMKANEWEPASPGTPAPELTPGNIRGFLQSWYEYERLTGLELLSSAPSRYFTEEMMNHLRNCVGSSNDHAESRIIALQLIRRGISDAHDYACPNEDLQCINSAAKQIQSALDDESHSTTPAFIEMIKEFVDLSQRLIQALCTRGLISDSERTNRALADLERRASSTA